ncbi:hypothetical protein RQP46_006333 [Phenoliferia psychrophenolica]
MASQTAPLHFHIFGFPVLSSKSPILHSAAYAFHGLPHTYDIQNCKTLDDSALALIRDPAFGGCSVTMPHKTAIRAHIDAETPIAKLLGAVNTVIPKKNEATGKIELLGDNTDWLDSSCTGLVIGAGGAGRAAVYALHDLGLSTIYIYNRTTSRAEAVKSSFPSNFGITLITSLEASSFTSGPPICIVGTVPASATSTTDVANPGETLFLSKDCVSRPQGGCIIEMAYLPRRTPLVRLAEGKPEWVTQTGIMVLLAQGYAQFQLWTGLPAPEKEVRQAVLAAYDKENPL